MIDTTEKRQAELVKDSLGKEILKYLDDPEVNEVYINQDYSLRIDTISGRRKTDVILTSDTVARICKSIAGINRQVITEKNPELGVEIRLYRSGRRLCFRRSSADQHFSFGKSQGRYFRLKTTRHRGH